MTRVWQMLLIMLLPTLVFVGLFLYERMIWNECRATNSFWYCVRVVVQ